METTQYRNSEAAQLQTRLLASYVPKVVLKQYQLKPEAITLPMITVHSCALVFADISGTFHSSYSRHLFLLCSTTCSPFDVYSLNRFHASHWKDEQNGHSRYRTDVQPLKQFLWQVDWYVLLTRTSPHQFTRHHPSLWWRHHQVCRWCSVRHLARRRSFV